MKRVLSFVLSLSVILTSMAVCIPASAAEVPYTVADALYYNDYSTITPQIFEDPNSNGYYFRQAVGYS